MLSPTETKAQCGSANLVWALMNSAEINNDLVTFQIEVFVQTVLPDNAVHMFWLLPQYILLTMGEIMFSITSLAFAFTQVTIY